MDASLLVTDHDKAQERLKRLHSTGMTWRKIASLEPFRGVIPAGSLASFARGTWEPKNSRQRAALGLPLEGVKVKIVSMGGEIPEGSQAAYALQCSCGQWFISNHPRRKKCFVCSPYRRNHNGTIEHVSRRTEL